MRRKLVDSPYWQYKTRESTTSLKFGFRAGFVFEDALLAWNLDRLRRCTEAFACWTQLPCGQLLRLSSFSVCVCVYICWPSLLSRNSTGS